MSRDPASNGTRVGCRTPPQAAQECCDRRSSHWLAVHAVTSALCDTSLVSRASTAYFGIRRRGVPVSASTSIRARPPRAERTPDWGRALESVVPWRCVNPRPPTFSASDDPARNAPAPIGVDECEGPTDDPTVSEYWCDRVGPVGDLFAKEKSRRDAHGGPHLSVCRMDPTVADGALRGLAPRTGCRSWVRPDATQFLENHLSE